MRERRAIRLLWRARLAIPGLILLAGACGRVSSPPAEGVNSLPDSAFHVTWGAAEVPRSMQAGGIALASVTFKNASPDIWPDRRSAGGSPPGAGAVRLSYRWWTAGSPLPTPYEARADLRTPLRPGDSATLSILVKAPSQPGEYRLQFDLVQELVAWFEDKGVASPRIPVSVR